MPRESGVETAASFSEILLSSCASVLACLCLTLLGTLFGPSYGNFLFMGVPLFLGGFGSAFLERSEPRPMKSHWSTMFLSVFLACAAPLAFAYEGLICIAMALPLIVPMSIAGMFSARALMASRWRNQGLMFSLAAIIPIGLAWEGKRVQEPELRTVTTQVVITAPPEEVWPLLFNLKVEPAKDWLLRSGIAHPTEVRSGKAELGSWRDCVLSTGTMRETIVACELNRRMTFEVHNTPPSMTELNPFGEVKAAHLNDWCEAVRGEFRLRELPGGRTLIEGQSWYRHRYAPGFYWSLWTDSIVSRVHHLVFDTITGDVATKKARTMRSEP